MDWKIRVKYNFLGEWLAIYYVKGKSWAKLSSEIKIKTVETV